MPLNLAITGATGRMGRRIIALARESGEFKVVAALVKPHHSKLGLDAGEVLDQPPLDIPLSSELTVHPDVLIDFSTPDGLTHWVQVCTRHRVPLFTGTTGLLDSHHALLAEAALEIPVIHATNTSFGVAVLNRVAADMARYLGDDYDIEIVEHHHRHKKDAPSGTAATLANKILHAIERNPSDLKYGRHGETDRRVPSSIGMHSLRMGDVIGTHTVNFAGEGERLEVTHVATSRDTFARGALRGAKWLAGKPARRYSIEDVLGI
jgi:4-hydroxy-tetrahydrodipicolinate reductase